MSVMLDMDNMVLVDEEQAVRLTYCTCLMENVEARKGAPKTK